MAGIDRFSQGCLRTNDFFLSDIILQRGGAHSFRERLHARSYGIFVKLKFMTKFKATKKPILYEHI